MDEEEVIRHSIISAYSMDLSCSVDRSIIPSSETVIVVARDSPSEKQEADSACDSQDNQHFSVVNSTNQQQGIYSGTRYCLICGQISHGFHFGILACRACAAFFRRTVVEKKSYKCRQNCQCLIRKEMRNMCRACRFQKCELLGMNKADVQMNRDPIGRRKENSTSTSTTVVNCCIKSKQCCSAKLDEVEHPIGQPPPINTMPSFQSHLQSFINSSGDQAGLATAFTPQQQQLLLGQAQQQEQLLSHAIATSMHNHHNRLHEDNLPTLVNPLEKSYFNGFNVTKASLLAMPQAIKYSPPVITSAPTIDLIPHSVPCGPSMLQRMLEGFINFQSSQKSLYTVMYPGEIFATETYRMVKHSEFVKMERGCLSLMYSMLNDWYQPFDSLIHDLKVATLREFSMRFTLLDQCFRTMQTFTNEDKRFVIHYGQYIDSNDLEYFFSENKDPKMLARMAINIMIPCKRVVSKMRQMVIRDVEIAALAGIILWNEVGHLNVEDTDKIRNQIYSEIHNNMILTYGVSGTGARLGSLMGLLHDFDVIRKEISESVTIGKIFNPHHYEVWDDI